MNRIVLLTFGSIAILMFGCRKNPELTRANTATSTISTSGTETTGTTSTTSTGSSGGTISSLNAEDKEFFIKAAEGSMAEVRLGQMAADKATNDSVKNFANWMVRDHGKAVDELQKLAMTKGLALPAALTGEDKKTMDELSNKVGTDFDKSYMTDMIKDHEMDVKEFEKAANATTDPDLKAWATRTLPVLHNHLKMAKQTAAKLKV
jgi:putative membrane protein